MFSCRRFCCRCFCYCCFFPRSFCLRFCVVFFKVSRDAFVSSRLCRERAFGCLFHCFGRCRVGERGKQAVGPIEPRSAYAHIEEGARTEQHRSDFQFDFPKIVLLYFQFLPASLGGEYERQLSEHGGNSKDSRLIDGSRNYTLVHSHLGGHSPSPFEFGGSARLRAQLEGQHRERCWRRESHSLQLWSVFCIDLYLSSPFLVDYIFLRVSIVPRLDRVFDCTSGNREVYEDSTQRVVEGVLAGINGPREEGKCSITSQLSQAQCLPTDKRVLVRPIPCPVISQANAPLLKALLALTRMAVAEMLEKTAAVNHKKEIESGSSTIIFRSDSNNTNSG